MASPCPICKKDARSRDENPLFPFCSKRCKTIDLGKWLNEEYRVPVDDSDDEPDPDPKGNVRH